MIQTVIFDLGGVLIEDPSTSMLTYFANYFQVSTQALREALQPYWNDWQKGLLSEETLWRLVTADLPLAQPPYTSLWFDGLQQGYRENQETLLLLKQLKSRGYTTALLSNTETPLAAYFKQRLGADIDRYFLSCEMGLRKPERAMYETVLQALACQRETMVFIDDRSENVEAAALLGIPGIVFRSCADLREHLPRYQVTL